MMLEKARVLGQFNQVLFITHSPAAINKADYVLEVRKNEVVRIK
jgi:DNA repair ATPase RecN